MARPAGTYAIFETSQGNIVVRLLDKEAPKTVANFVGLAEGTKEFTDGKTGNKTTRPYYDGLIFHRVIPNFMIQGGCPEGSGRGGPGYTFGDEFHPSLKHSTAGRSRVSICLPGGFPVRRFRLRESNWEKRTKEIFFLLRYGWWMRHDRAR